MAKGGTKKPQVACESCSNGRSWWEATNGYFLDPGGKAAFPREMGWMERTMEFHDILFGIRDFCAWVLSSFFFFFSLQQRHKIPLSRAPGAGRGGGGGRRRRGEGGGRGGAGGAAGGI